MTTRDRTAWILLSLHVAATLFASLAFATILNGPPPAWLQTEPNATIYALGWRFSGPTVVVLGALAALLHSSGRLGSRAALKAFAAGSLLSLGAELLGTSTGFPFGGYAYTSLLGYRLFGLVPFPIPISWYFMLYCSLAMCGRLLTAPDDSSRTRWRWALVAGTILAAWDVAMDPAMVVTAHWVWKEPGGYYGMPWSNWVGWLVTGILVARLMLAFLRPTVIRAVVAPSHFPLVLYAVNGVMSVTICAVHGFTWAWLLGTLAMAIPVVLAARRRPS